VSRIGDRFATLRRSRELGFVAYITAGDPTLDRTLEYALALDRAGADVLELGVPFSDPLADGVVIQRASERALRAGTNLAGILALVRRLRKQSEIPFVIFTYLNPVMRHGFARFADEAAAAGADGVLLTDLSVEEAGPFVGEMRRVNLDTIFLAAPTSTERRLRMIAEHSRGFVYAVSRTGVTGSREALSSQLMPLVERLRAVTDQPIAAGFGISTTEHMALLRGKIDAAVVGSALVAAIERDGDSPQGPMNLEKMVRELKYGHQRLAGQDR
jgi:tryptophan synthase alpha chain